MMWWHAPHSYAVETPPPSRLYRRRRPLKVAATQTQCFIFRPGTVNFVLIFFFYFPTARKSVLRYPSSPSSRCSTWRRHNNQKHNGVFTTSVEIAFSPNFHRPVFTCYFRDRLPPGQMITTRVIRIINLPALTSRYRRDFSIIFSCVVPVQYCFYCIFAGFAIADRRVFYWHSKMYIDIFLRGSHRCRQWD